MTTKRKRTNSISRTGVNHVRAIVERQNSTFQEIELGNDLGNDAYIEFVVEESATGCCIAAQIKCGESYVVRPGEAYRIPSDQDHFEYWHTHTLPVVGIVYDPGLEKAFWVDITRHLREKGDLLVGPHSIPVSGENELTTTTFPAFRSHFLSYREQFSQESNLGTALASFADRANVERCWDGLRGLFAFHRHQSAAWYYLISCISNFRGHDLLRPLVARLCHIPGHGDVIWSDRNTIPENVRASARDFLRERLDRRDVVTLLEAIDDRGVERGSIGQCVHAILDQLKHPEAILESIAVDPSLDEEPRLYAIHLAVYYAQQDSADAALGLLSRLRDSGSTARLSDDIRLIEGMIREHGAIDFY